MNRATQLALFVAASAMAACDRGVLPDDDRLAALRRRSTLGTGPFYGRVFESDSARCWALGKPVAGVRVEIGLWDGMPAYYKDTLTHEPPNSLEDSRFQFLTYAVTDSAGRFRFLEMPRSASYAMRAIRPGGSPLQFAYGTSLFGVPEGGDLSDWPPLCLRRR